MAPVSPYVRRTMADEAIDARATYDAYPLERYGEAETGPAPMHSWESAAFADQAVPAPVKDVPLGPLASRYADAVGRGTFAETPAHVFPWDVPLIDVDDDEPTFDPYAPRRQVHAESGYGVQIVALLLLVAALLLLLAFTVQHP